MADANDVFVDKRGAAEIIGAKWWKIDRLRQDPTANFPEPFWLSTTTPRWSKSEVLEWMRQRPRGGVAKVRRPIKRRGKVA
jgi:predicted DNA-binding transcriptional regulator AlpA